MNVFKMSMKRLLYFKISQFRPCLKFQRVFMVDKQLIRKDQFIIWVKHLVHVLLLHCVQVFFWSSIAFVFACSEALLRISLGASYWSLNCAADLTLLDPHSAGSEAKLATSISPYEEVFSPTALLLRPPSHTPVHTELPGEPIVPRWDRSSECPRGLLVKRLSLR